ncbi:3-methyl-2-oxobutanoate dehydrogenase subunit beta [Candidatus Bathyarchaeota archaeon]|nr:3-methyl-2-oxobutanoate dehydrogenase subunit beta [Candidatus Bathyarchaeota archaeon]
MVSLKELAKEELILPGNASCAGCTTNLSVKLALKALGKKTIFVVPACCTSVLQGVFPLSSLNIPVLNVPFASTGAAASGVVAGLRAQGIEDIAVVGWAGDGGTVDIGIQALSGAAERGTDFIYVCYDNEAYGNTGMQRSGSTPLGAWTTTTPKGKAESKKDMPLIMAAHKIPYIATLSPSYPTDFIEKFQKAKEIRGTKYLHILGPCPPGWRTDPSISVEMGRLAVQTGSWTLFEIEKGTFSISTLSTQFLDKTKRKPVQNYLEKQGRFRHLTPQEINRIQLKIDETWEYYSKINQTKICP